ncbi:hypothetical protein BDV32DRAFT_148894 [Aspergillus pseudonomiae]|uniref:Uncharacterized protein n=1 Tax=Aspergillus pseudonomiae TaxID=1506151 RepID=A0A5N7DAM6_9EURO|nr:uncharacterized protein BDV37DRAFT_283680 [Aspergillus pseudonomiae]KAB8261021.1 hypothetical protein BDV32DRAFT_148894 [Aspergillus pseudonomiae]KAE8403441.1 hypothetical protein BDV37DRAFT_283680 [Aspergillus pseudonomiae]
MALMDTGTLVIGELRDDEVERENTVRGILRHLIVNILIDFENTHLYSSRLFTEEDEGQFENKCDLTADICSIMEIMATIRNVKLLQVTWFKQRQQLLLRESLRAGCVTPQRVSNFIMITWEDMVQARIDGSELAFNYEEPPWRIVPGKKPHEYGQGLGRHHLGKLYPLSVALAQMALDKECTTTQRRASTIYATTMANSVTLTGRRIYPRPVQSSPDEITYTLFDIYPHVSFPVIGRVLYTLSLHLFENDYRELRHIPYRRIIQSYNGPHRVTSQLLESTDSRLEALEGKVISVQLLDNIRLKQSNYIITWPRNSGYLDYVTDDRDMRYWRPYVGQSSNVEKRIKEHIKGAARMIPDSLHYFVIHKGNGMRAMNFIRLWSFTDHECFNQETKSIFANILEMAFAFAFQSLPPNILEKYFGRLQGASYSGLGLNVIEPLLQGISLRSHIRQILNVKLGLSPDPHIRMWPSFRERTKRADESVSKWHGDQFLTKWKDYQVLFDLAMREAERPCQVDYRFNGRRSMNYAAIDFLPIQSELAEVVLGTTGEQIHLKYPVGNPEARIGIILPGCPMGIGLDETDIPWGIHESGFNETNCIMWYADPRLRSFSHASQTHDCRLALEACFLKYNRDVIQNSNLTVIIYEEVETERLIIPAQSTYNCFEITLYCGRLSGFFEAEGTEIRRVYLKAPTSLTTLWADPGPRVQLLMEAFKLAAALTGTQGIRPYFCNSASAVHHILRIYHEENNGSDRMNSSNIDPIIESFLFRKGFRCADDIRQLEDIGGTLARGLMLLLFTLRRKAQPSIQQSQSQVRSDALKRASMQKVHRRGVLSKHELEEMERIYTQLRPGAPLESGSEQKPFATIPLIEVVSESIGSADEVEIHDTLALVHKKQQEMIAQCDTLEEQEILELEMGDIEADDILSNILPVSDTEDMEQHLVAKESDPCGMVVNPVVSFTKAYTDRKTYQKLRDKSILEGKMYAGYWHKEKNLVAIRAGPEIAAISLEVHAKSRDELPAMIMIQAVIQSGKRHPEKWAIDARDNDPGAKLAFLAALPGGSVFLRTVGEGSARKANTFVDWLSGDSIEMIGMRPRRHINAHNDFIIRPLGLPGKGTWYTDDEACLVKGS